MNSYKSISNLKADARQRLIGFYPTSILCLSVYYFVYFTYATLPYLVNIGSSNKFDLLIKYGLIFLGTLLIYKAKIGVYNIFLKITCGEKPGFNEILTQCFPARTTKNQFFVSLFRSLIDLIFVELATYLASYFNVSSITNVLIASAGIVLLTVIYIYVDLVFTPLFFLIDDIKDRSIIQLALLSSWLMKGQKLKLLKIKISFIPMLFLGTLSCGFGLLYVLPYQYVTLASFYLNVTSIKSKNQ